MTRYHLHSTIHTVQFIYSVLRILFVICNLNGSLMMDGILVIQCLTLVTKTSHVTLQVPCLQHILLILYLSQQYLLCNTHNRPPVTEILIFSTSLKVFCTLVGSHQYFGGT